MFRNCSIGFNSTLLNTVHPFLSLPPPLKFFLPKRQILSIGMTLFVHVNVNVIIHVLYFNQIRNDKERQWAFCAPAWLVGDGDAKSSAIMEPGSGINKNWLKRKRFPTSDTWTTAVTCNLNYEGDGRHQVVKAPPSVCTVAWVAECRTCLVTNGYKLRVPWRQNVGNLINVNGLKVSVNVIGWNVFFHLRRFVICARFAACCCLATHRSTSIQVWSSPSASPN